MSYPLRRGAELLEVARRQLAETRVMLADASQNDRAEQVARGSLSAFRSAMDCLEDTERFAEAHQALDDAGVFVRRAFPCLLTWTGTHYEQRCPVALAHLRMGFSVGMIIRESECSICGKDPRRCWHIKGRTYDGEMCVRIIRKADLIDVSLVDRPANPEARILSIEIPTSTLREQLGPDFASGVAVSCDRCLQACDGLVYPFQSG